MNWLHLLSGGLSIYSIETSDISQPVHFTASVALLICLIPSMLQAVLASDKNIKAARRLERLGDKKP